MDKIYSTSQEDHDAKAQELEDKGYKEVSKREEKAEVQTTYQNDDNDRKTLIG